MSAEPGKRPAYEPVQRLLRPTGYNPSMPRPAAIRAGVALLVIRVLAGALVVTDIVLTIRLSDGLTPDEQTVDALLFLVVGGGVLLVDAVLAAFIWFGKNWARLIVMIGGVVSVSSTFAAWWDGGQELDLPGGGLISLGLDVLVLLALSSRDAAAYARRNERR